MLGVTQAEIQDFIFMHKALSIFGFYCHFASTFYSFLREERNWSGRETQLQGANRLEGRAVLWIKEVLVGFLSISWGLSLAR